MLLLLRNMVCHRNGIAVAIALVLIIWHSIPGKRKPGKVVRLDKHERKIS